jgi:hypothetical protein
MRFPGVVVHESRRLGEERWTGGSGLARTEVPRSVIDAAAWQPWPRFARLVLPSAVQQRACTPTEFEQALAGLRVGPTLGEIVVLEIDGGHHIDVVHWQADMRRERGIVISRRWVLRATTLEVRLGPAVIVADLKAMGVPTL